MRFANARPMDLARDLVSVANEHMPLGRGRDDLLAIALLNFDLGCAPRGTDPIHSLVGIDENAHPNASLAWSRICRLCRAQWLDGDRLLHQACTARFLSRRASDLMVMIRAFTSDKLAIAIECFTAGLAGVRCEGPRPRHAGAAL